MTLLQASHDKPAMELGKVAKNVIKCVATGEVRADGLYWCPFFAKFDILSCVNHVPFLRTCGLYFSVYFGYIQL